MSNKTIKEVVSEWKNEAGINRFQPECTAIHLSENTLFIITRHAGMFIGRAGTLIDKYREIFKENGYEFKIEFVDIFCGDIKEF